MKSKQEDFPHLQRDWTVPLARLAGEFWWYKWCKKVSHAGFQSGSISYTSSQDVDICFSLCLWIFWQNLFECRFICKRIDLQEI